MGSMSFGIAECVSFSQILQNDAYLHPFSSHFYEEETRKSPPQKKDKKKKKSASSPASSVKSMLKSHVLYPIQEVAEAEGEAVEVIAPPDRSDVLTSPEAQTPPEPSKNSELG